MKKPWEIFLYDRKVVHTGLFLSYKKRSAWMRTRAKMKMSLMRLRSAQEFRKRNSLFLSVLVLLCLSACGRIPSVDSTSTGSVVSGSAVSVASRKAETVSLERREITSEDLASGLQFSAKEQIEIICQEKAMWYWEPKDEEVEEAPYFAVTDFDMDGYLEILVMENPQGQTELYEVNEQRTGLTKCEISEDIFNWSMDNPLCAYEAEETGKWYLGEKPSDSVGEVKKYYIQYCSNSRDIDSEQLLYTWEEFTLYEALDIREWEKKLTAGEKKQLHAIAGTMGLFGGLADSWGGNGAEYAVCDLDQDGSLDLLMRISTGSGIIRESYIGYAVEEEGIKMIMDGGETKRAYPKSAVEEEEQQQENFQNRNRWFLCGGIGEEISCYQEQDSGEIQYVFQAVEGSMDFEEDTYGSGERQYQMVWDNPDLVIQPFSDNQQQTGKQGKALLRWVDRCAIACPDYQYENALASYLGWELQWQEELISTSKK